MMMKIYGLHCAEHTHLFANKMCGMCACVAGTERGKGAGANEGISVSKVMSDFDRMDMCCEYANNGSSSTTHHSSRIELN